MTLNTQAIILLTFLPLHNYREFLRNLTLFNCAQLFYNVIGLLQSAKKCTTSKNISTEKFQETLKKSDQCHKLFCNHIHFYDIFLTIVLLTLPEVLDRIGRKTITTSSYMQNIIIMYSLVSTYHMVVFIISAYHVIVLIISTYQMVVFIVSGVYYCFNMVIIMMSIFLSSMVVNVSRMGDEKRGVSPFVRKVRH